MFCDMHGHSRKYGVFIYGCEKKAGKDSTSQAPGWPVPGTVGGLPGIPVKCQPNIFPLMLYLNAPDLFSYKSCNFKVSSLDFPAVVWAQLLIREWLADSLHTRASGVCECQQGLESLSGMPSASKLGT